MSESECLWFQRRMVVPRARGLWILNRVEDDGWGRLRPLRMISDSVDHCLWGLEDDRTLSRHPRPRSGIQMSESECLWFQRRMVVLRVQGLWILNRVEDDGWVSRG
jgi:hypothetical protein